MNQVKYIWGGLGDFLLSIDDALLEPEIDVYTHYNKPREFFEEIGVKVRNVHTFHSLKETLDLPKPSGSLVNKRLYSSFGVQTKFSLPEKITQSLKPILGIHPFRSDFGNEAWMEAGFCNQNFDEASVKMLINKYHKDYEILLFGTTIEHATYTSLDTTKFFRVDLPIWQALALAEYCDRFIANDSVFKTWAASRSIPSWVMMGNYQDEYRDRIFIKPYSPNEMKAYKYSVMCPEAFTRLILDFDNHI